MRWEKWHFGLVALIVVVGIAIGIWLIAKNSNGEKVLGNNSEQSETTTIPLNHILMIMRM